MMTPLTPAQRRENRKDLLIAFLMVGPAVLFCTAAILFVLLLLLSGGAR